MADQEFLASFGVEIDETGLLRLQEALTKNRALADDLAAAFNRAQEAMTSFFDSMASVPMPTLDFGSGGIAGEDFLSFLTILPDEDLRRLMTVCLEHCEVRLPAGWNPVMTRGEWSYVELEHDVAICLKLTIEEVLWTLEGFFGAGASGSQPATPDS